LHFQVLKFDFRGFKACFFCGTYVPVLIGNTEIFADGFLKFFSIELQDRVASCLKWLRACECFFCIGHILATAFAAAVGRNSTSGWLPLTTHRSVVVFRSFGETNENEYR